MALTIVGEYYLRNKVRDSSNFKEFSSKTNNIKSKTLKEWQSKLGIDNWCILCEPIDEMQVLDDLKGDLPGHEFVGISIDFVNETGIIYHTRPLKDDDIVHELLHVCFPEWSEQIVNYWTDLIINQPEIILPKTEASYCNLT
ncbi:TlpA family protein disulfide reductase [Mariniflexile gromovii]|uniref:Uncharacterized protein n=1 Tax=Mariniflexile gromovii TaxID=362523 RepID=A0ABS4BX83_9FLAO|nr:hypothetical protein [Mariniflexile gromovii]MBP0904601.1 hypothetical protein [Mariniflexile gromovii]